MRFLRIHGFLLLYENKEKHLTCLISAKFYFGISASEFVIILTPGFCLQLLWYCLSKLSLM